MFSLSGIINGVKTVCNKVVTGAKHLAITVVTGVAVATTVLPQPAMAALPTEVGTSLSAAQADILEMIGLGFAYVGVIVGLMVVLGVFIKILKKGRG